MPDPSPDSPPDSSKESGRRNWVDDLTVAATFLTRVPLPHRIDAGEGRLARAAWAIPVVGIGIGLVAGFVYGAATALGLPPTLGATAAVAMQIWLTGALHEDALGDVADGFGGGATREEKLRIMRDSHLGTFAVLTLVIAVVARIAALAALAATDIVFFALLAAGAASRAGMVAAMANLEPVRGDGLGFEAGRTTWRDIWITGAIAAAAGLPMLGIVPGLALLAGAAVGSAAMIWLARRRIGGQTGDVLGACQQAAEIMCLAALVAVLA
jgi:adenosylcobinamide-GDP ribazoletransferase